MKSGKYGEILDRTVQTGITCIEQDNASVLSIGCGGLVWLVDPAREELKKRGYDIILINPFPVAVEIA